MTNLPPPDQDDLFDPALEALAAAILDGSAVDLDASPRSQSVDIFANELRVVAGVAALHRSLSDDDRDEAPRFPPELPWRVGTHLITASLGRGTYGEVFRAWDDELHRDVAIKLLFAGHNRGDVAARALDEGRLLARVRHPNVVAVHGVERIDGRVGLVTEFIQGRTLAETIRESGPLDAAEGARIGSDLARALQAVHDAGLLHRDVKAQNVMREPGGRVVLMDFGAGLTGDAAAALAGTPLYLAPEVLSGGPATPQSDIYSAGVLLHYLLTAGYPVAGASLDEIRAAHRAGGRVKLRNARPDLPRTLADAIDRATEPDPSMRYGSAVDMSRAIDAASGQRGATRRAMLVLAALAVLATAGLLWQTFRPRPAPLANVESDVASRVTLPPHFDFGGASFDGRYLAYVDSKQSAWVMQLGTGHTRRVAEGRTPAGDAESMILSSDGSRAAYAWRLSDNSSELRVADIEDRWPQSALTVPAPSTLLHTGVNETIVLLEWSRDGSSILFSVYRNDGRIELMLTDRAGHHRTVHTFNAGPPRRAAVSSDGRFVVFDHAAAMPSPQRDLFIVPADGSSPPSTLIGGPSNDELPLWSADGSSIVFMSDRGGAGGAWRVAVRDGVAAGSPRLIARGTETLTPAGVTRNGDLYYSVQTKLEQLHTVPLGPDGCADGPPRLLPNDRGSSRVSPSWSPDGSTLAFTTLRGMNLFDHASVLSLRSADGVTREVAPQLSYFSSGLLRWTPEGRYLLVRGRGLDGYFGFHRIDLSTGAAVTLVRGPVRGRDGNFGLSPTWGPGGHSVIYIRPSAGIVERRVDTGLETVLVAVQPGESLFSTGLAPQGDRLAFAKTIGQGAAAESAIAIRESNGTLTELVRQKAPASLVLFDWTPDGNAILYGVVTGPRVRLWRLPAAAGGVPFDTGITIETTRPRVSLHPDGRSLTYGTGSTAYEVWVMRGIAR